MCHFAYRYLQQMRYYFFLVINNILYEYLDFVKDGVKLSNTKMMAVIM
jgi:hypothetical protein